MDFPKSSTKSFRDRRSEIDPLEALCKSSPMNTTTLCAVESSKQGTMVVGSGSLFYSNRPFNPC